MAAYNESLTIGQGNTALRVCEGLRIARAELGYGQTLVLQFGRLKREVRRLSTGRKFTVFNGQLTCSTYSDWRAEKPHSIQFGSGFSDHQIDKWLNSLIGTRINAVALIGRLPELRIELDDGRIISTFTDWSNQPQWSIGFNDTKLFNLRSLPPAADISPWMHVRGGRLHIEHCYDDANPVARQFIRQLGHA